MAEGFKGLVSLKFGDVSAVYFASLELKGVCLADSRTYFYPFYNILSARVEYPLTNSRIGIHGAMKI